MSWSDGSSEHGRAGVGAAAVDTISREVEVWFATNQPQGGGAVHGAMWGFVCASGRDVHTPQTVVLGAVGALGRGGLTK